MGMLKKMKRYCKNINKDFITCNIRSYHDMEQALEGKADVNHCKFLKKR